MENWGGITYYETTLLFDPQNSSVTTKQRVYEVIAHEVAHQWFGDLVTMAWWDNLWLNEGFASWIGTKCTAHFNPQWEVWLEKSIPRDPARRIGIPKEQAMEGDARATTHPIQQPVATEGEANNAFDDITYKKGQSFLRMLESFLGEEPFRDGIRGYWYEKNVPFNASLMKQGTNQITLTIPPGNAANGIEYDYLRLELNEGSAAK